MSFKAATYFWTAWLVICLPALIVTKAPLLAFVGFVVLIPIWVTVFASLIVKAYDAD